MPFVLQTLRALIESHPDRAARLKTHIEALEVTIVEEPARCLERVRALFEATQLTIGPHLGVTFVGENDLTSRNSQILKALDFKLIGHPDAEKIDKSIRKLVGSINGTIGALAELSNVPGLRHGGSLDWGTLERQHALMLGGLCDALVSFLFDVAWSRPAPEAAAPEPARYGDFSAFNAYLDEEHGDVEIAGATFPASHVLYLMDATQYDAARLDWEGEQAVDRDGADEAA